MKDFITRHIKGQAGVSLVQTLVGAAIVGGLSLVAAKLSTQDAGNKMAADANYGVIDLTGRIQTLVSNAAACQRSFLPHQRVPNQSAAVGSLVNANGDTVFAVNGLYSDKKVKIVSMNFLRANTNSVLSVEMERIIPGKATAANIIRKEFFINAKWTSSNTLESCASDINNFMDTVLSEAFDRACKPQGDVTTTPQGLVQDKTDPLNRYKCKALYQMKEDNSVLRCPAESSVVGLIWHAATRTYRPDCKVILGGVPTCNNNELLRRDSAGKFQCVSLTCPSGQIAMGVDPSTGLMKCMSCPTGTYLVSTSAGWQCKTSMCANYKNVSQQYFVGFNTSGDPVCHPLLGSGTACSGGGSLRVGANGGVEFDCCTPSCSGADQQCVGTAFASTNNCGSCQGTKPADCSNASNFCVNTLNPGANGCGTCPGTKGPDCSNNALHCTGQVYNSNNGCGTCTGSMPTKNATWSDWTATSTFQAKPGASCSATCGSGTIATQRKYVRSCSNDEACGGTSCVGAAEEFRDEGTTSCSGTTCACTPSCTAKAENICRGYSITADDYCGGKCPTVYGTSPYTPASGRCMYNPDDDPASTDVGSGGGSSSGGGGGGCFIAGTQITMHDGVTKNIEDILVGDRVLDGQKKVVTVQKLIPLPYSGQIYAINGGGYFFTPNHPFLTVDGWKSLDPVASMKETSDLKVAKMKVGDILMKRNGMEIILSLDSISTTEKVYNFELDGSHEYIADEYIVHNKSAEDDTPVTLP